MPPVWPLNSFLILTIFVLRPTTTIAVCLFFFQVPTTAATSLFNLDSMRQQAEDPQPSTQQQHQQHHDKPLPPTENPFAPSPNRALSDHRLWASAAAATTSTTPVSPSHTANRRPSTGGTKLKVPPPPTVAVAAATAQAVPSASLPTPVSSPASSAQDGPMEKSNAAQEPANPLLDDGVMTAAAAVPEETTTPHLDPVTDEEPVEQEPPSGDTSSEKVPGFSAEPEERPVEDATGRMRPSEEEIVEDGAASEADATTPSHLENASAADERTEKALLPAEEVVEECSDVLPGAGTGAQASDGEAPPQPTPVDPGGESAITEAATAPAHTPTLPLMGSSSEDPSDTEGDTQVVEDAQSESADNGHQRSPPTDDCTSTPPPVRMDRSADEAEPAGPETAAAAALPEHLLEQFSKQLQRLEENFQAERLETQRRHENEIRLLQDHSACQETQRDLELRLQTELQRKDAQLQELARRNEGLKLKMDVLKREVVGTQQLLEAKDGDMGKVSSEHQAALVSLEQKVLEAQGQAEASHRNAERLQSKLESVEAEFDRLRHEHADLKGRVKAVATELKDRRVECRELKSTVEERGEENERLERELERLRFQLSEREKSRSEKDEEMEQLRAQVVDLKLALDKAETTVREHDGQSEKVLAEYKRKAQNSLALANSRAAAAVQAKEEAELEARAARSTADSAMERAVTAELSSKAAAAEARALVKSMEQEKNDAVKSMTFATEKVEKLELALSETENKLAEATVQLGVTTTASKAASERLRDADMRISDLEGELEQSQARSNALRQDIATLREQLQRAEAERDSNAKEEQATPAKPDWSTEQVASRSSEDATIRILQEDLREANNAIEALKEALSNSLALNESYERSGAVGAADRSPSTSTGHRLDNGDSSSTPLFYAMEKQAELNTARDEIMRLANLLSNVQSEKMEAIELKEEMRHRMEEAESRLLRYEKLAAVHNNESSSNGTTKGSSAVNIEYLKNIMLRYLNAKTLSEKKALVPVIGAVLCLTPDEQNNAVRCLDESASLGGVGSSLFDTFNVKLR